MRSTATRATTTRAVSTSVSRTSSKRGKYLSHLGHELVGNQVAYHYLQYANTTLLRLLRSQTITTDIAALVARSAKARNVKSPLPHAALCTGPLCDKHLSRPRCAYSSLPKHAAPDVGDLVSNASAVTRWSNVAVGGGKHDASCGDLDRAAACGDETSLECFSHEMACSHGGQTRAFEGFAGSGPLQPVWKSNLQPDFNVRVIERFGPGSFAVLRELDESNRSVQKSAESTSI